MKQQAAAQSRGFYSSDGRMDAGEYRRLDLIAGEITESDSDGDADPAAQEKFRLLASRDDRAVRVHDFGEADDTLFIAMELLRGASLRSMVDEELPVLGVERTLEILRPVADALAAAICQAHRGRLGALPIRSRRSRRGLRGASPESLPGRLS